MSTNITIIDIWFVVNIIPRNVAIATMENTDTVIITPIVSMP